LACLKLYKRADIKKPGFARGAKVMESGNFKGNNLADLNLVTKVAENKKVLLVQHLFKCKKQILNV
jgi:hypothetical protein